MATKAPRTFLRSRALTSALLLAAVTSSQACMKGDCADTESCGTFVPNTGCGWRLDDGSTVFSTDDLEDEGGTWTEADGWTLPNGSHPEYLCDLPMNTAAAGTGGNSTNGGQSNGGSTSLTAGNGGDGSGNSGAGGMDGVSGAGGMNGESGAGQGGDVGNGGDAGSGGVETDGGSDVVLCTDTPETGCTPSQVDAVFVDAAAPNGGDGTLESPLNSVVEAVALASANNASDIYICAGSYDETLYITDNEAGIDVHGGFNCNGFTYDATAVPVISPSNGTYALQIEGLASALLIEDLAFTAVDADDPGESSIAAFISESTAVTLQRCQFTAGAGANGDDGILEEFVEGPSAGVNWPVLSSLEGNDGTSNLGGATNAIMCPAGDTNFGGNGGSQAPTDGAAGGPFGRGGSAGQEGNSCFGSGSGGDGTSGPDGFDGEGGSVGVLDATGFSPGSGGDGTAGETGGGGGGGAGTDNNGGNGGGGGGAGGCGGNFGPGGQGGGASIALLVFESTVNLNASILTTNDAGDGGNGDVGQEGQHLDGETYASIGGIGPSSACEGGSGGGGGDGGAGGGGAGGISVAVLWTGADEPVIDQATANAITLGQEGATGLGAAFDNDGEAGIALAVAEL